MEVTPPAAQSLEENFRRSFAALNPEQQQAVAQEHLEGAMMVLAGPGTGKTQVLGMRVANLIRTGLASAPEILCLTFTENGAYNMRRRLQRFVGNEAYRVRIGTFHNFCNGLIDEHPEYFQDFLSAQIIDELETAQLMRELIHNHVPPGSPLGRLRGDLFYETRRLKEYFGIIKREGLSVEKLAADLAAYRDELPNLPEFIYSRRSNDGAHKAGDIKQTDVQEETDKIEKAIQAAELYPKYNQLLQQKRRYEFADMIRTVNEAFAGNEGFLQEIQERYKFVLVDEFQDTNGAQLQVVQHLIRQPVEEPNVFVVGDEDQSIYRFQGANLWNFVDLTSFLYENFPGYTENPLQQIRFVNLKRNYRSSQVILDWADTLITHNTERLQHNQKMQAVLGNTEKTLVAARPVQLPGFLVEQFQEEYRAREQQAAADTAEPLPSGFGKTASDGTPPGENGLPPRVVAFPDEGTENQELFAQIKHLVQDQQVPPAEIAVLYAKHAQGEELYSVLQRHGLPVQRKRRFDVLKNQRFAQLRLVLEYLKDEYESPGSGDIYLGRLLRMDFWGISPAGIELLQAEFTLQRQQYQTNKAKAYENGQPFTGQAPTFRSVMLSEEVQQLLPARDGKAIARMNETLQQLVSAVGNTGIERLVDEVLYATGLLAQTAQSDTALTDLKILRTFKNWVRQQASKTEPNPPDNQRAPRYARWEDHHLNLRKLLSLLETMEGEGVALNTQLLEGATDGVFFSTAHGAKGLEFDYVFIIYLKGGRAGDWPGQVRPSTYLFPPGHDYAAAPQFAKVVPRQHRRETNLEEKRRLLFVAITRARLFCQLSWHQQTNDAKKVTKSQLVEEMTQAPGYFVRSFEDENPGQDTQQKSIDYLLTGLQPGSVAVSKEEEQKLSELRDNFRLSATSLRQWLECRRIFYYEALLKLPQRYDAKQVLGNVTHKALERHFQKMRHQAEAPDFSYLRIIFLNELEDRRGRLSRLEYNTYTEWPEKLLEPFYTARQPTWSVDVHPEAAVFNVTVEEVPIGGKIDVVFNRKGAWQVLDFKTGGQLDVKKRLKVDPQKEGLPEIQQKPEDFDYWMQLMFYRLLLQASERFNSQPIDSIGLQFIEPNKVLSKPGKESYEPYLLDSGEHDEELIRQLIATSWSEIQQLTAEELRNTPGGTGGMCGKCAYCKMHEQPEWH